MSIQIMSVSFEELESGIPAICICSEFSIPIMNKTLAKSFINFYNNDLKFKLNSLSGNKVTFKWYNEDTDVLELYYKNEFVGYVLGESLNNIFSKISNILERGLNV